MLSARCVMCAECCTTHVHKASGPAAVAARLHGMQRMGTHPCAPGGRPAGRQRRARPAAAPAARPRRWPGPPMRRPQCPDSTAATGLHVSTKQMPLRKLPATCSQCSDAGIHAIMCSANSLLTQAMSKPWLMSIRPAPQCRGPPAPLCWGCLAAGPCGQLLLPLSVQG